MKIDIDIDESYTETTIVIKACNLTAEVSELIEKLKSPKTLTILGFHNEKFYILNPKDIIFFYTKEQKIWADTSKGTFEIKDKLYELEETLKNTSFVRISKFALANVNAIKNIEVFFNGSLIVNFTNGKSETISRRYVKNVKEYLGMRRK